MAQRFSDQLNKQTAVYAVVFVAGLVLGKVIPWPQFSEKSPDLVTFGGKALTVADVESGMSKQELTGNSPEYEKQIAMNMVREKVLADLASKEGLSVPDFIKKIKSGADDKISDEEVKQFIKERSLDTKKLTKAQHDNIVANMQERKRELYFNEYLNKALAAMNVDFKNVDKK